MKRDLLRRACIIAILSTASPYSSAILGVDSQNRLKSATENITPNGGTKSMSWQQTFDFDRYGNRNFVEANTNFTGFDKLCESGSALCDELRKVLNPEVNQPDNRLSSSDGYVFDDAGNTMRDPQLRKFTYDAENKQVKVESIDSGGTVTGTIGEYVYDGDGKRIKKIVPSAVAPFNDEVTVFVYDAAGNLVAEYATEISQDPKVSYTTADHLGSPRMLTDENGATISRRDFHPFGEEILTTHRRPDLGYTPDDIRQKFTSYERDVETNLDFAQARYYSNQHGRFTSVDPLMASARVTNPTSWNRYTYVLNNPLRYIDPDGMDVQVLDEKARENLLKTLPKEIRDEVRAQIDKDGKLKRGSLNKIKSNDQNFNDLKTIVNHKDLTEVMTATNSTGEISANFFQRTAAENKEYDIQNFMKDNNVSRAEAENFFKELGTTWEDSAYYGYTLKPSESPSGNLRIVVTDQTGEATNVSEETAVVTTGHELYGHGLLYRQGKAIGHDTVPDAFFDAVEKRTLTNYQTGQQNANTPETIKPNQ